MRLFIETSSTPGGRSKVGGCAGLDHDPLPGQDQQEARRMT